MVSDLRSLFSQDVCLVGNAESILDHTMGAEIDRFSTVVRLNRGYPKKKKAQGKKTDIVGLSCSIEAGKHRRKFKAAPIIWMTPKRDSIEAWMRDVTGFTMYPEGYWAVLSEKLGGKRPSTGAMMIDLICNYVDPERLLVVGFDFKQTKTLFERKDNLGPHDWEAERQLAISTLNAGRERGREWSFYP